METHYDGVIKKAKEDSEALLAKMNDQLKANKDANDAEIADVKKQLADELAKVDQSQIVSLNNMITELITENNNLKQQVNKLTPVHVKSVDDVAKQTAFWVIVDDDTD